MINKHEASYSTLKFSAELAAKLALSEVPVIVTGGSGWIGQVTLEMLEDALGDEFERRVHVYGSSGRSLSLRSGRMVSCAPLSQLADLKCAAPPMILHYAFLTRDLVPNHTLADFVQLNTSIGDVVGAAAERLNAAGLFVPSSGAVYRADRTLETDLERNPYGALKLRDEQRFTELAGRLDTRLMIMRVFNLAGPFIKFNTYVLGSILVDILKGGPIVLKADHPVIRSFVHIGDVIELAVGALFDQKSPILQCLDTLGEVEVEVGELAILAAAALGNPDTAIVRPALKSDPVDRYVGGGEGFTALAARSGIALRDLLDQIHDTADYLRGLPVIKD